MFYYNFKYELTILLRSRWIQLISLILLLLFVFASLNGKQKVEKREADIELAREAVANSDESMLKLLDSIEQGYEVKVSSWQTPSSPIVIGNFHPQVAAMEANSMSFIAVGQSDVFTHFIMPTVNQDDHSVNLMEMTSSTQLLFGSFDLSFVIIYLLPLIIIAFSYNVLSAEKERGSLSLLASQPISIHKWLFQKLGLRLLWMFIIVILVSICVFIINHVMSWKNILFFLGLCFSYMLFWFSLALIINIRGGKSATNVVSLLGLWIVFVLLIPSLINQVSEVFAPIPPRSQLVNQVRELKEEASEKQDQILDNFLRSHPEYSLNDSTQTRTFWHNYIASQELLKDEITPVLEDYENRLETQQNFVSNLQWFSPAILLQSALETLAGTAKSDYENFRQQTQEYSEVWREYFIPLLYNNELFTLSMYDDLPRFTYNQEERNSVLFSLFGLNLLSVIIVILAFRKYHISVKKEGIIPV